MLSPPAAAAGVKMSRPVKEQVYGGRGSKFKGPFGHRWWIASQKEALRLGSSRQVKAKA